MAEYEYHTVDVFTAERFGGNPLAVFPKAEGLSTQTMQALAAEMNYSETTFVLPPENPAHTAKVRIFNRTAEMPFAGHPNVGTACVLAKLGLAKGPVLKFEELAGIVPVKLMGFDAAEIEAPQALQVLGEMPVDGIAACLSLNENDIVVADHQPVRATVGVDFVLAAVKAQALSRASPDLNAFRNLAAAQPEIGNRLSIFLYAREWGDVRARMFAPLSGTWEDPATGSANATLAALLLSLKKRDEALSYNAIQGVEMGRRSELSLRAWRADDGVRASVGGKCASVFSGRITI